MNKKKKEKLKYYHATRYRYKVGDRIKHNDTPLISIATTPILHSTIDSMLSFPGKNYSECNNIWDNIWKKIELKYPKSDFANGTEASIEIEKEFKKQKLLAEKLPIFVYQVEPIGKISYSSANGHLYAPDAEVMKIIGNARGIYNNYYKGDVSRIKVRKTDTTFAEYLKAKRAFKHK